VHIKTLARFDDHTIFIQYSVSFLYFYANDGSIEPLSRRWLGRCSHGRRDRYVFTFTFTVNFQSIVPRAPSLQLLSHFRSTFNNLAPNFTHYTYNPNLTPSINPKRLNLALAA
jgi:hypothetical protein